MLTYLLQYCGGKQSGKKEKKNENFGKTVVFYV